MEYKAAIIRYEKARQLVSNLKQKRLSLIGECEKLTTIDDPEGYGKIETGILCLNTVFNEMLSLNEESREDGYSYTEILEYEHDEGRCCDSCYQSYQIKVFPLADAKKDFGMAKRALSNMGKKLIKGG